jgi:hypothetical protein
MIVIVNPTRPPLRRNRRDKKTARERCLGRFTGLVRSLLHLILPCGSVKTSAIKAVGKKGIAAEKGCGVAVAHDIIYLSVKRL